MGKLNNTITMLGILSNGRKYSIQELSSIIEVTPRMIRVYKEDLEKSGIYIDTIRGKYGGYVLRQGIRIPARKFSERDIELLKDISSNINDEFLLDKFKIFSDKVVGIYSSTFEEGFDILSDDESVKKYNFFSRAIKEKKKVKIIYYSFNKGENERIVHPYNLFLYNNGWGVASFCEVKKDLRHFELNRIIKYELLNEKYE